MRMKSSTVSDFSSTRIGKAALQFGNHVAGLGDVERARGDEQNMIGAHEAVACVDGGAFDDRQNVALHALAADVRAVAADSRPAILSISSRKMMPLGFHAFERHARHLIHVDELLLLFLHQVIERLGHAHLAAAGSSGRTGWAACL